MGFRVCVKWRGVYLSWSTSLCVSVFVPLQMCVCVYSCLCDCKTKLEGEIRCIQGDCYCIIVFFFLLLEHGDKFDHRCPTFHKFTHLHGYIDISVLFPGTLLTVHWLLANVAKTKEAEYLTDYLYSGPIDVSVEL